MKLTFKPEGINISQKQRSILEFICDQLDDNLEDKITTNGQIGASLQDLYEYKIEPTNPMLKVGDKFICGYLQIDDHRLSLEIDPHMRWGDSRIFMGDKEITIDLEPTELI